MEGAKGVFPSSQIFPFLDRLCSFSFFITNNHRTIKGSRFHSQVMMIIIVVVSPISIGFHHGGHSPEPNGRVSENREMLRCTGSFLKLLVKGQKVVWKRTSFDSYFWSTFSSAESDVFHVRYSELAPL